MNKQVIKQERCLTRHGPAFLSEKQAGKQMQISSVCGFCFRPSAFICFLFMPSDSRHLLHSLPPSTGWAGVHMIKPARQVITWRCQIKWPLIQMRSEISKSLVASTATAHPCRRRRGDLRARGAAGRQRQHSAFHSYINITNVGNRVEHVRVHPSVGICITQPACPLLAAGILDGGCSATSTAATPLHWCASCCAPLQRSEVGNAWI